MEFTVADIDRNIRRRSLEEFALHINPQLTLQHFHTQYYRILTMFARREIKNLIITMPPQHGKSEGSTRLLPAFMLGLNPDLKLCIASYNDRFAQGFNRSVQQYIDHENYYLTFPETYLNSSNVVTVTSTWLRNAHEFQCVEHSGGLLAVGRGGGITGKTVDVVIMDDLYKDSLEGNSPIVREAVIAWYTSAVLKRLHNDSQQLIVFTRWHEEDLIGYIEEVDTVVKCDSFDEIEAALAQDPDTWIKINFQAIKESDPTEFDPRDFGQALWEERHGIKKLLGERKKNKHEFECMNQGEPAGSEGLLYRPFKTYKSLPNTIKKGNYTDTADTGMDYLCSVCYEVGMDKRIYITDVVYTPDPMEETEDLVPEMIENQMTRHAYIESNNGGRGFARVVESKVQPLCKVEWFHQSGNKESRIHTNSAQVNEILMPEGWEKRWPIFYLHLKKFKRLFKANKFDDAPDALTGIIEKEVVGPSTQTIY